MWAVKLCTNKILQFLTADAASWCRLTCIMAIKRVVGWLGHMCACLGGGIVQPVCCRLLVFRVLVFLHCVHVRMVQTRFCRITFAAALVLTSLPLRVQSVHCRAPPSDTGWPLGLYLYLLCWASSNPRAVPLYVFAVPSGECHWNLVLLSGLSSLMSNKNWLLWQCLLRDRETNFRLVIYSHSSTSPGPIDVEMVGLTEIVNNIK